MRPPSNDRPLTVVGAGFMGTVLATIYARHGYDVRLADTSPQQLETFEERARPIAESLVTKDVDLATIFRRVTQTTRLEDAVQNAFFVQEAIHENLAAKQDLFRRLDKLCGDDVVLATNTSSFRLSEVFRDVGNRSRVIGVHFITPAHIIRLVEVVVADFTPKALVDWTRELLATIDHVGVVATDSPGFLVNRLQYALVAEAYRIVEEGVATRDDVDTTFRLSLGPRLALWGPLLTEDLVVSKKTTAAVWDYLHGSTAKDNFRRPPQVDRFIAAGSLGAASGEGWYRFGQSHASTVISRDRQLKALLDWLKANDRSDDFKAS